MTRTAGAQIGCQRPSRFWGLGCPKIYHEAEDTLVFVSCNIEHNQRVVNDTGIADLRMLFLWQGDECLEDGFGQ
ncbi:hypothetical protein, partial [Thiolapillus sp.]